MPRPSPSGRASTSGSGRHSPVSTASSAGSPDDLAKGRVAPRACEKCTRSKRKCDKAQPACGRCTRLKARCTYDFSTVQNLAVMEPASLADFLQHGGGLLSIIGPQSEHLGDVLDGQQIADLLSSRNIDWRDAVDSYFRTVHHWFTILSREKLEAVFALSSSISENSSIFKDAAAHSPSPDLALLLVCVYLNTHIAAQQMPGRQIWCALHRSAKRIFALLKTRRQPTMELMQCGALLSNFEYGHGDPVSAYRTLSDTVTMARVVGLAPGKAGDAGNGRALSADEFERHSLWWGLFILDQTIHEDSFINHLPPVMDSPPVDGLLPPSNGYHDAQSPFTPLPPSYPPNLSLGVYSSTSNQELSAFQRAAQATLLLHRALRWQANQPHRQQQAQHSQHGEQQGHHHQHDEFSQYTSEFMDMDLEIRLQLNTLIQMTDRWEEYCFCITVLLSAFLVLYGPMIPALAEQAHTLPLLGSQEVFLIPPNPHTVPSSAGTQVHSMSSGLLSGGNSATPASPASSVYADLAMGVVNLADLQLGSPPGSLDLDPSLNQPLDIGIACEPPHQQQQQQAHEPHSQFGHSESSHRALSAISFAVRFSIDMCMTFNRLMEDSDVGSVLSARAALDARAKMFTGYPGTPSSTGANASSGASTQGGAASGEIGDGPAFCGDPGYGLDPLQLRERKREGLSPPGATMNFHVLKALLALGHAVVSDPPAAFAVVEKALRHFSQRWRIGDRLLEEIYASRTGTAAPVGGSLPSRQPYQRP